MNAADCRRTRKSLGAFVDGELGGADRLRVTRHLEDCVPCEREAEALRDLGAALRAEAPVVDASAIRGLAGGVVSRLAAEFAESWHVRLRAVFEDWHWVMVGTGSLLGTAACTLFVASMLLFGPIPERSDSLAGRLNNSDASPGTLFVFATTPGDDKSPVIMQFEGPGAPSDSMNPLDMPSAIGLLNESALASAFADMVTRGGRIVELSDMPEAERHKAVEMLDELFRLRSVGQRYMPTGPVTVHGMWLVTEASVSAKAL